MRTQVKSALPEMELTRIVEALGQELIDASDEEILQAAQDLGMNPHMKGSAAFHGLTVPARLQVSDFFDVEALKSSLGREARGRIADLPSTDRDIKVRASTPSRMPKDGKDPGEE